MSPLLAIEQVDPWLQFNPHILSGYRPRMSARDALRSFLGWHNESFNIWLHTLAACFVFYLAIFPPAADSFAPVETPHYKRQRLETEGLLLDVSPETVFRCTCIIFLAIFICSVGYHLLMPCMTSETSYRRLLNCDVIGILTSITGTSWSFLYHGNACATKWSCHTGAILLILSYVVVFYNLLFVASVTPQHRADAAMRRTRLLGFHCVLRFSLLLWMELPKVQTQGHHQALNYHVMSYVFFLLGGVINVFRFPEKQLRVALAPQPQPEGATAVKAANLTLFSRFWQWVGQYLVSSREIDYAWNSHNLWHYCVILSVTLALLGCHYDMVEFELTRCSQ